MDFYDQQHFESVFLPTNAVSTWRREKESERDQKREWDKWKKGNDREDLTGIAKAETNKWEATLNEHRNRTAYTRFLFKAVRVELFTKEAFGI